MEIECPLCFSSLEIDEKRIFTVKSKDETITLGLAECCGYEFVVSDKEEVTPGRPESALKGKKKTDIWVTRGCPLCDKCSAISVVSEDCDWYEKENVLIQECFPYLSIPERETIKTSWCYDCQRKIYPLHYDEHGNFSKI